MAGFRCPRCRMALGSRPLLRLHEERLCPGAPPAATSCPPGGAPLPAGGDPGTAGRPQDTPPPAQQEPRQGPAPGHGRQQPALREAHERRVSEIRARTRRLEQQREALCRRLAARAAATPRPEQGEVERSRALRDQAGRLRAAHGGAAPCLETAPPAGPLAAEARALRLAYLRAGGSDPAILDQLLQLQVEAALLEKGPAGLRGGRRTEPPGAGGRGLDAALLAVELENRRLEDELLALKVRRERRADAGSRAAQQHMEELAQLQAEVGMLRCHAEWMGPQLPPAILPPPVAPPLLPALAAPELFAESPRPALTGSPAAPSHPRVPPSLPLAPFRALEDPPPAREPPAQHKPRRSRRAGGPAV
ncbi:coiled-coil domain-containing protein 17 isoform X3 [Falco cherrug]|uniref:coiled-coil domain-containing protein 17 isoform X3 n=1 Tax=Falco cherrug TaxID=345164 RepID=UPI0024784EA5|nr:coiled-coil domain-containing protein 17 isoform X3 [Falco cherrug]XP_055671119.1 coiled-coil domain-containing protein 17 isoform X3 [Falco peregrinus]